MSSSLYSGSSSLALGTGLYASTAGLWSGGFGLDAAFGFNPAALFAAGEQGFWYDPSDLATVWQDSARTTPGAVGQPVGCIDDKSGRGNNATQATAGARPTLRQDGTLYYLEFAGSHWLGLTNALASTTRSFVVAGARHAAGAAEFIFAEQSNSSTTPIRAQLQASSSQPRAAYRADNNVSAIATGAATTNGVNKVFAASYDGTATIIRSNAVQQASANGTVGTTTTSYGTIGGSRAGGGAFAAPLTGHIYGLIGRGGTFTTAQLEATERWMNSKTGAY